MLLIVYRGQSETKIIHPGLAEIPVPVGSQDVMSQMRDCPFRES